MLDPAVLWTPSNDTSRPIFSDSLNLTPPAPLLGCFKKKFFEKYSSIVANFFHFVLVKMYVKYFEIITTFRGCSRMKFKIGKFR